VAIDDERSTHGGSTLQTRDAHIMLHLAYYLCKQVSSWRCSFATTLKHASFHFYAKLCIRRYASDEKVNAPAQTNTF